MPQRKETSAEAKFFLLWALAGALELIKNAMERLAGLGSQLDPGEGAMMRAIAERFASALGSGHKDAAKEAAGVMRRKAGDTKKEDRTDW